MSKLEKTQLQLGYIPLLDCIALLWAKARFLRRSRFRSYFSQRSILGKFTRSLAFGLLDAAHCLSAMLPAAAIGADQIGIHYKHHCFK
jgi:NitT/TauT family transport system ATP-binding protein